ncbi:DUF4249 family protein, partial [Bacteroidota bacterium]
REIQYIESLGKDLDGIRFYLDLIGSESDSRYYRWGLTETWEYHSISHFDFIKLSFESPASYNTNPYEYYYCWRTEKIPGLYSSSTVNLTSNQKKKIPLNHVSGNSNRLIYKYSMLVEQYSLNEGAYNYWNRVKVEAEELGGLHTQQPGQVESNLVNMNDMDEVVLGYFWVAAKSTKRIFISHPTGLYVSQPCRLEPFEYETASYPLYIAVFPFSGLELTSEPECLDCRILGGSNIEPSFWE